MLAGDILGRILPPATCLVNRQFDLELFRKFERTGPHIRMNTIFLLGYNSFQGYFSGEYYIGC